MKRTGQPLSHESARGHVTGEALYTDDLLARFAAAAARLARAGAARPCRTDAPGRFARRWRIAGVVTVLTAADVPGEGDSGPVRHDEPHLSRAR